MVTLSMERMVKSKQKQRNPKNIFVCLLGIDFTDVQTEQQAKTKINDKKCEIEDENFDGRKRLAQWLNKQMKIEMTDGRIIIGDFVCTDRNANIILSSSVETYNAEKTGITDAPRTLGLVMIPGRHVVSICHDQNRGSFRKL